MSQIFLEKQNKISKLLHEKIMWNVTFLNMGLTLTVATDL